MSCNWRVDFLLFLSGNGFTSIYFYERFPKYDLSFFKKKSKTKQFFKKTFQNHFAIKLQNQDLHPPQKRKNYNGISSQTQNFPQGLKIWDLIWWPFLKLYVVTVDCLVLNIDRIYHGCQVTGRHLTSSLAKNHQPSQYKAVLVKYQRYLCRERYKFVPLKSL